MSDELCTKKCIFHADTHDGYCDRLDKLELLLYGDGLDKEGLLVKLSKLIESFSTVRLVVYSGIGLTLATVFGAVVTMVIKK